MKNFAKAVLNKNPKAFVIHITSWLSLMTIYLARKTQVALLFIKKLKNLVKYLVFSNVFSEKKALMLSKITKLD